jgi:O-methyltransferase
MTGPTGFVSAIVAQVLEALSEGASALLLWGYTAASFTIIAELNRLGVQSEFLVGLVDERASLSGRAIGTIRVFAPSEIAGITFDTIVIATDEGKEEALRSCVQALGAHNRNARVILAGLGHLEFRDTTFEEIVQSCLVKSYATGYSRSLIHLYQSIRYLGAKQARGDVAEFGICKGGTVVFIKKVLERFGLVDATVYGFDIFEGFPSKRSLLDLYRHPKCEFKDFETVVSYCERFGVKVIKGDICETYTILRGKPLVLSFFDTDNYSPTRAALELCAAQTVSGGVLFFDHFTTESDYLYTIGERIAANEVLSSDQFFNPHGTGLFIKI